MWSWQCKLLVQEQAAELVDAGEERDVLDQVRDPLAGLDEAERN